MSSVSELLASLLTALTSPSTAAAQLIENCPNLRTEVAQALSIMETNSSQASSSSSPPSTASPPSSAAPTAASPLVLLPSSSSSSTPSAPAVEPPAPSVRHTGIFAMSHYTSRTLKCVKFLIGHCKKLLLRVNSSTDTASAAVSTPAITSSDAELGLAKLVVLDEHGSADALSQVDLACRFLRQLGPTSSSPSSAAGTSSTAKEVLHQYILGKYQHFTSNHSLFLYLSFFPFLFFTLIIFACCLLLHVILDGNAIKSPSLTEAADERSKKLSLLFATVAAACHEFPLLYYLVNWLEVFRTACSRGIPDWLSTRNVLLDVLVAATHCAVVSEKALPGKIVSAKKEEEQVDDGKTIECIGVLVTHLRLLFNAIKLPPGNGLHQRLFKTHVRVMCTPSAGASAAVFFPWPRAVCVPASCFVMVDSDSGYFFLPCRLFDSGGVAAPCQCGSIRSVRLGNRLVECVACSVERKIVSPSMATAYRLGNSSSNSSSSSSSNSMVAAWSSPLSMVGMSPPFGVPAQPASAKTGFCYTFRSVFVDSCETISTEAASPLKTYFSADAQKATEYDSIRKHGAALTASTECAWCVLVFPTDSKWTASFGRQPVVCIYMYDKNGGCLGEVSELSTRAGVSKPLLGFKELSSRAVPSSQQSKAVVQQYIDLRQQYRRLKHAEQFAAAQRAGLYTAIAGNASAASPIAALNALLAAPAPSKQPAAAASNAHLQARPPKRKKSSTSRAFTGGRKRRAKPPPPPPSPSPSVSASAAAAAAPGTFRIDIY